MNKDYIELILGYLFFGVLAGTTATLFFVYLALK